MNETPALLRSFRADRGDTRQRLDHVLRRHLADLPEVSRHRIQTWIHGGRVTVNRTAVVRPAARVWHGDEVEVAVPPLPTDKPELVAQPIPLDILYEDEHLIAIDKPAGLVVHPTFRYRDGTVLNALLWYARAWPAEARRPALLHRLDRNTSGVLLAGRSLEAHLGFARLLRQRAVDKRYLAVVYGSPLVAKGRIDLPLYRDAARLYARTTVPADGDGEEGRPSLTLYERLAETTGDGLHLALLCCRPVTGRTHQIRVHLAARQLPILGDVIYGGPRWSEITDPGLAAYCRDFPRQALHAWRLALPHPVTGRDLELVAAPPADLVALLDTAGLAPARTAL